MMRYVRSVAVLAVVVIFTVTSNDRVCAQHTTVTHTQTHTAPQDTDAYVDIQIEPKLLSKLNPIYPAEAKKKRLEGRAYISVLIDTAGRVVRCVADHVSNPVFLSSAIHVAKNARFSPAIQNGKPISVWWMLPVYFSLEPPINEIHGWGRRGNDQIPSPVVTANIGYTDVQNIPDLPEPILVDSFQHFIVYPEQAKREGREGTVRLKILLDGDGNQTRVDVVSVSDSIFLRPALDAIAHARFAAPKFYNHSDTATAFQTVEFKLNHALDRASLQLFPNMPEIRVEHNDIASPVMRFDIADLLVYPPEAKQQGLQGAVNVSAEINERGIVLQTVVGDSTNPIFNTAAQTAVEHMLFEPARNASGPIKTWWTVPVVFRLPHDTH